MWIWDVAFGPKLSVLQLRLAERRRQLDGTTNPALRALRGRSVAILETLVDSAPASVFNPDPTVEVAYGAWRPLEDGVRWNAPLWSEIPLELVIVSARPPGPAPP